MCSLSSSNLTHLPGPVPLAAWVLLSNCPTSNLDQWPISNSVYEVLFVCKLELYSEYVDSGWSLPVTLRRDLLSITGISVTWNLKVWRNLAQASNEEKTKCTKYQLQWWISKIHLQLRNLVRFFAFCLVTSDKLKSKKKATRSKSADVYVITVSY